MFCVFCVHFQVDKSDERAKAREQALLEKKEDRRLMFQAKQENCERIKKLQQMRKEEMLQRMAITERRLEQMKVRGLVE